MTAIIIKNSNLLESDAQYIVHQANCVTWKAAHLAYDIFKKFPYADIYEERYQKVMKDHNYTDKPGMIMIRGDGNEQRYVIAILGQKFPGKPRAAEFEIDSFKKRQDYFFSGLQEIAKISNLKSIAFPWGIGCGAAGGNWKFYHNLIDKFSNHLGKNVEVSINKLSE